MNKTSIFLANLAAEHTRDIRFKKEIKYSSESS